jgi:hypothetical protein
VYNVRVQVDTIQERSTILPDHRDALVGRLRELGIRFLAPTDADAGDLSRAPVSELIAQLAAQPDARLRMAVVPLLILHPDRARDVQSAVEPLAGPMRSELQALYTAAVYLQRLWRTRLGFYLGDFEILPDIYSKELGLPAASERHGKTGLHALVAWQAGRSPYPFNWLAAYTQVIDLLFEQLKQETNRREPATAR